MFTKIVKFTITTFTESVISTIWTPYGTPVCSPQTLSVEHFSLCQSL